MSRAVNERAASGAWTSTQAYVMAVICLLIGIAVGYFLRGSAGSSQPQPVAAAAAPNLSGPIGMGGMGQQQPSPQQMKQMADTQAAPLLARLNSEPNNAQLLAEIGNLYYDAQQYTAAIGYYDRALKLDPTNPNIRTDMGTAYFYTGDPDRAISEFQTALKHDPKHAQTMFNMGMVKWQGKSDVTGAVQAWEQLLKAVPDYPERAKVEGLIQKAKQHATIPPGTRTDKPASM